MKKSDRKSSIHIPINKEKKEPAPEEKEKASAQHAKKSAPDKNTEAQAGKENNESRHNSTLDYDEMLETLQRLKAEYANYQKRTEKEREEYRARCVKDVYLNILPVLDNLERAISAASKHEGNEELLSGIELILKQFQGVLATEGVKPLDSIGEKFDPRYHDALMVQESDEYPPDTIISEVERGYMIDDKVLRAAKVTVSRKPQEQVNRGEKK